MNDDATSDASGETAQGDDPAPDVLLVSARPLFARTFGKVLSTLRPALSIRSRSPPVHARPSGAATLVLLDMAGLRGTAVGARVRDWREGDAARRVVPVLDEPHDASVEAAMTEGAAGVMLKAAPPGVIVEWLDALLDGAVVRPAPSIALADDALDESLRGRLSPRRQLLLRRVMGGHAVSAIARELGTSAADVVAETRLVMDIVRGRDADRRKDR